MMAASYAALVSLMHIIDEIEHHHSPPISLDKQQVESLTENVTFLQKFLEAYNPPATDSEEARDPLEMRIADAAYAAEDVIESHIVENIQLRRRSSYVGSKISRRFFNFFRPPKEPKKADALYQDLQRVIEEMDLIKSVATNIDTEKAAVHERNVSSSVSSSTGHNTTLVGSDDVLLEIMEKLTGDRPNRQVIPIVGMGGIGKTALARNICARPLIKEHFDICAWATISQQYNTIEIICEVFSQATNSSKEHLSGMSEDVLGSELHKHLFGRRFLIVMDDMWRIDAWDKIQHFFPDNENGSRILVTTRLSTLSSQLNYNYRLQMNFLDEVSSWDLFCKTVFGEKSCPSELMKIGKKIVDNCRGLPLSIVVVGGLLKKMDNTGRRWESIQNNLTSVVNLENDKHCLRLLKLSYNHLPVYLKPCFLYMGVFEEDDEISVSTLIKLWISEGFLKPMDGKSLETTATEFLKDLVDRNLILIDLLGSTTGNIKSCKIHDLLRDLCLKESQKDGLYHVIGQCSPQGINSQRRVVIPRDTSKKKVLDDLQSMPHVRSVICENGKVPRSRNLGLLRTFHAYKFRYYKDKSYVNSLVFQYVNLRHLAIEGRRMSSFLSSVHLLWNLHTLIVSCSYKATTFDDIWKLPQFRHIEFVHDTLCLPDPPSDGPDDVLVIMENLQILKGVRNFKCCEEVVKRIPNIKKLKIKYCGLVETNHDDYYCLGDIKFLCKLESLSVSVFSLIRWTWTPYLHKLAFPHSLKKLSLCMQSDFEWEDMLEKIGSLPLLEKFKLWCGCFRTGKWEIVEGQFPCLKYLGLFSCPSLEHWTTAEESSIFPRLEKLRLVDLTELKNIPCEIGNIPTLQWIWLTGCSDAAVKSAKAILDEQVELQGEQQPFRVLAVIEENEALQSLAGPNF